MRFGQPYRLEKAAIAQTLRELEEPDRRAQEQFMSADLDTIVASLERMPPLETLIPEISDAATMELIQAHGPSKNGLAWIPTDRDSLTREWCK